MSTPKTTTLRDELTLWGFKALISSHCELVDIVDQLAQTATRPGRTGSTPRSGHARRKNRRSSR